MVVNFSQTLTMLVDCIMCLWISCVCSLATGNNSLSNKHLKVAAELWTPFFIIYCNDKEMVYNREECPDEDKLTYGGALWDFLTYVKLARNVTFSILRPPSRLWGSCHGPNNCTGMIGMVNRGEVDFALGMCLVSCNQNGIIS